ncbi:MAG: glycosyltransferase family 4 protein [Nanoarchaeota archaeon]|nr:glycosyltransferase family 4 protein [Nanoarchaeota archaeon]
MTYKTTENIKILFTTPQLEHPPASGPTLRIENSIKALSRISKLHLFSRVNKHYMGSEEAEVFYRNLCISFLYAPSVSNLPPEFGNQQDAEAIIDYADTNGIDIIWFGFGNISYPLIKVIKSLRPQLKVVCDTDSVWSRFVLRELPYEISSERRRQIEAEGRQKEQEEADWVNFCDVTTAVSQVDADYYRSLADDPERIHIFSNVIDLSTYDSPPPPPADFKKPCIYLAGTFYASTSPMVRGTRWAIKEVLPLVQKAIPEIHFYIVGDRSDVMLTDIQNPHITITGKVKSVLPYLCHADVALVPLMFESGTRFKILEAGACGVPIVSTTLGAEGLPTKNDKEILIADKATAFAGAAIRLINNKSFAKELAMNCKRMVEKGFSVESLTQEAMAILKYLGK